MALTYLGKEVYVSAPEPDEDDHGMVVLETDHGRIFEMNPNDARELIEDLRNAIKWAEDWI